MRAFYIISTMFLCLSCMSNWLDIKPDKKMVLPSTLKDIDAMLGNTAVLNVGMPILGEVGTDDFIISDELWASMSGAEYRNAYIWAESLYEQNTSENWNNPYQAIFYANLALESLDKISDPDSEKEKHLRGSAYFYRAWSYFQLAQLFCSPFDASDASDKLGLPLRVQSDINIPSRRATVKETYDLIKADLTRAAELLPERQPLAIRPSKPSAFGLSAILYLQIGDFINALENAERSLAIYGELLDYNTLDPVKSYPFALLNREVLFHSSLTTGNSVFSSNAFNVTPELYNEFKEGDLRKLLFFKTNGTGFTFRGSYNGNYVTFNGICTDEIMLVKAECLARLARPVEAAQELEKLLRYRYKDGAFPKISSLNDENLLEQILLEKRKQLIFRGRRWWELRRLNNEVNFAKVLRRHVEGKTYELPIKSIRYTLPIPDDVIRLSGMEQNPR